ncbi:HAMP domain-containing histidine kinase [Clostridium botulinum]|uniref:histidine kinase n=1 Tax=Clostridium botulinum (strain Langeland / NCTC 10281 / Type F) TaxID=441772 RepID=A7GET2_CLOBL|nr:HAMP domain-containing sensor histidine kinase [Clostridium botulinum]ABS42433.1 sensor histidine kinase [Clostridium botulinum F str. Langeland]KKM42721.1 histidine kinase [Clostridium botulinum]MBD5642667.1 HAMP domain-containing histidine kinase [Clostridium botulinum]MBY6791762.1 HAMP domain-containing histidine kinase [Clostridium botulinum]MBY6936999.1 HAMP domain-containing histidine kinase [Clostridium botulinum]
MKNKFKKSIVYKLFLVTTLLLVISSICTYSIIYMLLPNYYHKYKKMTIENQLDSIVDNVPKLDINNIEEYLGQISFNNNANIVVTDEYGNVIYFTNVLQKGLVTIPKKEDLSHFKNIEKTNTRSVYTSYRKIKFYNSEEKYNLYLTAPLQPVSEASKVLFLLIPYIGLVVILISVIGGLIYSKVISKPLISMNKVAKEMAKLDFTKKCTVKGEDEIGELSQSLNDLSNNLRISMEELQRANEQLLDDIAKEREIEKKRREFIATISHELKTPITILKGQIEGMLSNIGIYKDRDKYLKRNLEVLNDMEYMVKETLEISKLESQGFKPRKEQVSLSKIVEECIYNISFIAKRKNIFIDKNINEDLFVHGDSKLLKKVVNNIITNAINHSPESEKVYANLQEEKDEIVLKVENTGIYIEENELKEIFKPFYRIEKSRNRKSGGSGLGLYIVKMILDAHNGKYSISNNEKGVEFKLCLKKYS